MFEICTIPTEGNSFSTINHGMFRAFFSTAITKIKINSADNYAY